MTSQLRQNTAEKIAADIGNGAQNIAADIGNDHEHQNKVSDTDVNVRIGNVSAKPRSKPKKSARQRLYGSGQGDGRETGFSILVPFCSPTRYVQTAPLMARSKCHKANEEIAHFP